VTQITLDQARAAKRRVIELLSGSGQVVGIGITRVDGTYAVKVNLGEALPGDVRVPAEIDGVRVRIEVVGTIRRR